MSGTSGSTATTGASMKSREQSWCMAIVAEHLLRAKGNDCLRRQTCPFPHPTDSHGLMLPRSSLPDRGAASNPQQFPSCSSTSVRNRRENYSEISIRGYRGKFRRLASGKLGKRVGVL